MEERVITELEVVIPVEFGPVISAEPDCETPGVVEGLCSSIGICRRAKC